MGKKNIVDNPVPSKGRSALPRSFLADICFLKTSNCENSRAHSTICSHVLVTFLTGRKICKSCCNSISLILYHGWDIPPQRYLLYIKRLLSSLSSASFSLAVTVTGC